MNNPWVFAIVPPLIVLAIAGVVTQIRKSIPVVFRNTVKRDVYLKTIIAASNDAQVERITVLAPDIRSRTTNTQLGRLQDAWARVAAIGTVRVLSGNLDDNLRAACELYERGVSIRLFPIHPTARSPEDGSFSFHLFQRANPPPRAILNKKAEGGDPRPAVFEGDELASVLMQEFRRMWDVASDLPRVLADRVESNKRFRDSQMSSADLNSALENLKAGENFKPGERVRREVSPIVALDVSARVIFVLGLPGSGKSTARQLLVDRLKSRAREVEDLSDYPLLYQYFITQAVLGNSTDRVAADGEGGFVVRDISVLVDALDRINSRAQVALANGRTCVIEFARKSMSESLAQFDPSVTGLAQIVYLRASAKTRHQRIQGRAQDLGPNSFVDGSRVGLTVSDDHPISSEVMERLYDNDDSERVRSDPRWKGRFHVIDTELDAGSLRELSRRIDDVLATIEGRFG